MARQERAEVLEAEVALEHRLAQVAERGDDRDDEAEQQAVGRASRSTVRADRCRRSPPMHDRRDHPADEPSKVLFGDIAGDDAAASELRADEVADDVVARSRTARGRG